ncbi:beta-xylosidase [Arthrobacter pigmenti]|uniref:Beta-xylosidase n=1 Tax=Arthrobacter pigmenti TaxID=271432 RepID=A0A846RMY9_9MICC|nr:family 43 glycosylhydrolase [Arthrobacter pigmenti]NJC21497.1 beta-xylosidase [Arthrobacter pigmenti]
MNGQRKAAGLAAAALSTALVAGGLWMSPVAGAPAKEPLAPASASTYTNPVTEGTVDTFPDPAMIRGKDGYWYAYGTTNPIFNSQGAPGENVLPILRSADMTQWEYVGDVYTRENQPDWWPRNVRPWAPDVRYLDGQYYFTYSLSSGGVGLATSDTPVGPWTDRNFIVPPNNNGCQSFAIDQAVFTDSDGTHYMVWGSYDRICISAMNDDASELVGEVTTIGQGRRMEGGFMVQRDGYYYLFYSDAGCCDGAFSGYTVKVGRSESPTGPFVDDRGVDLMELGSKAGFVLGANGNRWVGPGHNAIQTDVSGQDWMVYHGIPTEDPEFGVVQNAPTNLSKRPMMIDRLDWIDGWPVVRAGAGPSEGPETAPVTEWQVGSDFNDGSLAGWKKPGSNWSVEQVPDALGVLTNGSTAPSVLESSERLRGDLRVEADVRLTGGDDDGGTSGSAGVALRSPGANTDIEAVIDRAASELVLTSSGHGGDRVASAPLPENFDYTQWHLLALEVRGDQATVEVSADGLGDPLGVVELDLPKRSQAPASVAAISSGTAAQWNHLGAAALYEPVTERVPDPEVGSLLSEFSDEFSGEGRPEAADPAWSWVRGGASQATLAEGQLSWPSQNADLFGGTNSASVLLRDAPEGDFIVETKVDFRPTTGNQQAGIVLYENDNSYLKLMHTKLPLARVPNTFLDVTEFGKEAARPGTTPPTAVANGPMFGAMPADITWLRLAYHFDEENQEHDVRMASSTDGETWSWGSSWSLPATGEIRIGLLSMNRSGATAEFDYVRTYGAE